jgi:hypothetical protein
VRSWGVDLEAGDRGRSAYHVVRASSHMDALLSCLRYISVLASDSTGLLII